MLDPKEIDKYFNPVGIKKNIPAGVSRHTRRVALAKLALPGLAAILSVAILVVPGIKKDIRDFALDLAIDKGDIEKMNIEQTTIYITNEDNHVHNIRADKIEEMVAGSKIYDLTTPEAIFPLENKEWVNIKAPEGSFDQKTSLMHLNNNVDIFYSGGMSVQTREAFYDFQKSVGHSDTPVSGSGFIGDIVSEGFEFSPATGILTFLGKTRIIINEESLKKE